MVSPNPDHAVSSAQPHPPLIDIRGQIRSPLKRGLYSTFGVPLEGFLGVKRINHGYDKVQAQGEQGEFFQMALRELGAKIDLADADRANVPLTSPTIVVANHPYGGLDGIILCSILRALRPDVKAFGNFLLHQIPDIRDCVIAVDPFGGKKAKQANLAGVKAAIKHLRNGGMLVTFPSGEVSHLHVRKRRVLDPLWSDNTAGLVRRTGAAVLPVWFGGRNSAFFQMAGLVHPILRTILLPRELVNKAHRTVPVRIGRAIPNKRLMRFQSDRDMVDFLRLNTYVLENRERPDETQLSDVVRQQQVHQAHVPVAPEGDMAAIKREIEGLPAEHLLVEHGEFAVYVARAHEIPLTLNEIGRLREKTFREVGEGTGDSRDLDAFDGTYHHLFMWSREDDAIVGAYRMGPTDEILKAQGSRGLYTRTLFSFKNGLLDRLNPALEMGRSFICSEYQRKYVALGLIWRGIGEFCARNPRYRILFGPVSISQEYQSVSKDLIVQFLKRRTLNAELSPMVKAKHPPRTRRFGHLDAKTLSKTPDIEDISALISEIEVDGKGVPVLLRQYLKLNATMLSFNVDPEFQHCIDGLVMVDLCGTDRKILKRYMGEDGLRTFLEHHGQSLDEPAPVESA